MFLPTLYAEPFLPSASLVVVILTVPLVAKHGNWGIIMAIEKCQRDFIRIIHGMFFSAIMRDFKSWD
jgi:hypothetical protein